MKMNGEAEEAIRYNDSCTVEIQAKNLKRYASAKELDILLQFDIRTEIIGCFADYDLNEYVQDEHKETITYTVYGSEDIYHNKIYSRLLGKKVIESYPKEKCGIWPYENKKTYEEFIIGKDDNGEPVLYTCNPEKLNNYFGSNPTAPMYLTPVFFKREVLRKYYGKPELYSIEDGSLNCRSLWGMEIDNHHLDVVGVYLGDLGRDLPESEQKHWKIYNILVDEHLSFVSFGRDNLNYYMDSNIIEHQFKRNYKMLNNAWRAYYGWPLYLELVKPDMYLLNQIRRPLDDSQMEFDQLVLMLDKIIIEYLNEAAIASKLNDKDITGGINRLEQFLVENSVKDYREHIDFLRELHRLRSTGSGHRKGKDYMKIAQRFKTDERSLPDVFDDILRQADAFLRFLITIVG